MECSFSLCQLISGFSWCTRRQLPLEHVLLRRAWGVHTGYSYIPQPAPWVEKPRVQPLPSLRLLGVVSTSRGWPSWGSFARCLLSREWNHHSFGSRFWAALCGEGHGVMVAGVTVQSPCWTAFWMNEPEASISCDRHFAGFPSLGRLWLHSGSSGRSLVGVAVN